jgi:hypothetical protein
MEVPVQEGPMAATIVVSTRSCPREWCKSGG